MKQQSFLTANSKYYNGRPASTSVSSVNHKAVADSPVGQVLVGPLILNVNKLIL